MPIMSYGPQAKMTPPPAAQGFKKAQPE